MEAFRRSGRRDRRIEYSEGRRKNERERICNKLAIKSEKKKTAKHSSRPGLEK
ncbi:hypothetical protein COLO4_09845 [Corchorus olitorius]|uniref:Uncharacterized protein n=1 Tax=Corchorus olitorius TaxID=93759 RepID=A0A1R3KAW8_9ROSI|nr:hypothetical protein COLO4_09845 [Corchorus olitorius]